ncbi:hypothetical protein FNF27_01781 [Cafeteria roenbergensis]|uniref:Uncharacterized protein n=1 Tax=Cafeteria roenbergensis TaxID=33653 RepID=A0A5A8CEK7_CAFRO|nr:hypothetical protein FNF29_08221 [Cafeteria roenbergensis]KAA0150251.1 hypothetical protein FNF31_07059 [Cafeteria roenbergensis]KAA0161845.1 hypothetical protein FNF28_04910 [Cafeteria roenbergensis]KAA0176959.1 hypothetical protein FNF27_01781 [Cafeteria roenbergensis]|eukprot:KAA0146160.1 hypothetical protein FNF29_08221 [Cafeteria roenbergensis]
MADSGKPKAPLKDICRVLDTKYKRCVATVGILNAADVTDRCGGFFSDLMEVCSNELAGLRRREPTQ